MRAIAWAPAIPLLVVLPLLYFPERLGLASLSPWLRLALALLLAALAGALAARLDRAEAPLRVGALVAAPAAALGALLGVMTALAPEHLLLVAFGTIAFLACAMVGAAATTPVGGDA